MNWPRQSYDEMVKFYGLPGENQAKLALPYPVRLGWEPTRILNAITCHERVADSLTRVLTKVLGEYGQARITELHLDVFDGCLNVRKMRGGTQWSIHSWGAALDWDADRNTLKMGSNQATLDNPPYTPWWRFWEEEGWLSLGRARNYDWMHVQAAKP